METDIRKELEVEIDTEIEIIQNFMVKRFNLSVLFQKT